MAHHKRDAVVTGIDARDDAQRFGDRQAEPVHAGIDMDGGAAVPARAAAEYVPFGEFVEVADHGPAVDLGIGLAAVLEESVEHIERGRGRHRRADGLGLIERRDKEGLAAGVGKRAGDLFGAAAIGVGLDHAGAFGGHPGLFELAPVGDDGVEIDGQNAGGGRKRRRLVGFRRQDRGFSVAISDRTRCSCRILGGERRRFNLRKTRDHGTR